MVAKVITWSDATRRNLIQPGDWVNPYGIYSEEKDKVIIPTEKSGTPVVQRFKREDNLKCFYAKDIFGHDTLWFDTTKTKLFLKGECGYINGVANVEAICSTFSDLKMGLAARATTEKDINYLCLKKTAKNLLEYKDYAWLGSSFISGDTKIYYGMDYIDVEGISVGKFRLADSEGSELQSGDFGVRPAVSIWLPNRIFVDIESMEKEGAWRLLKK